MSEQISNVDKPAKIGLVAGWGRYPYVIARSLKKQGCQVYCLGIREHVSAELKEICDDYHEVGLGQLGAAIRYFRRHDVKFATMAGKVHKVKLFHRFAWIKHFPDWRCLRTFYPHWVSKTKDRKDDTLLGAIVEAFAEDGISFLPATDFATELIVKQGLLSGRRLTSAQQKDIEFGWKLAKEIGRLDIGQSVAVKGQAVLAVEAVEGTDQCIQRAGKLCLQGGFTLVKVAKPQQDMRFDVPTIGLRTLKTLSESGGSVLAIEAGKTILLDEAEFIEFANRHKITVAALDENGGLNRQGEQSCDAA